MILQPLFIILADFNIWKDHTAAITLIYLTWAIMVVPQSWVLYSRLHLVVNDTRKLNILMIVLGFTSVILSVPTIITGILLVSIGSVNPDNPGHEKNIMTCPLTTVTHIKQTSHPSLSKAYSIWSRLEMTIFFVQETSMNAVYIWQARRLLHSSSVLTPPGTSKRTLVLHHLIASNLLVIILDAALLGIQFASFFNLQGSFKPLVYGIKLKVEFAILNRLVQSVQRERKGSGDSSGNMWFGRGGNSGPRSRPFHESTKNYSARPEAHGEEIGMVPLRTTTGIWPNHSHDSQNLMIMGNAESPETHDTRYRGQQQIS